MSTRLSVVIPGYNTPIEWWARCVDSVLANISFDDEVICIDDGSDGMYKHIESLALKDPRIQIVQLPDNCGQAHARNLGVSIAKGKYVAFVDSDDVVFNDIFNKCVTQLEINGADVIVFGVNVIWPGEGLQKHDVMPTCFYGELSASQVADIYQANLFNYVWNKVFRKTFITEHNVLFDRDGVPFEDVMFCLDVVMQKSKWMSLGEEGYYYIHRANGSQVSSYSRKAHIGAVNSAKMWGAYVSENPEVVDRLGGLILSNKEVLQLDWRNIWLRRSPLSLYQRWLWLKENAEEISVRHKALFYTKKLFVSLLRRFAYVRPIRRWNLKRLHKNIEEWHG